MDNSYYPEIVGRIVEVSEPIGTLGAILGIIERWSEIEDIGNRYGIPTEAQPSPIEEPTEETTETPPEPPQTHETDGRCDIPPKPKETAREAPAAPPKPHKANIIISGPPGQILIITPTVNKNLILQNHDRFNNLASPHPYHRNLRLPRLSYGVGCNTRNLRSRHLHSLAVRKRDRQTGRGSPHSPGEGHRRMGTEMGKKTLHTKITEYGIQDNSPP